MIDNNRLLTFFFLLKFDMYKGIAKIDRCKKVYVIDSKNNYD